MLPTRLNVLPPDKQKNLQHMIRNEFIRSTLAMTIVVVAVIGMALVSGRFVLENYFATLADTITAVTVNTQHKNSSIEQANSRIHVAERVLNTYQYWPLTLIELADALPDGVVLSRMSIDREAGEATIVGSASRRDVLLTLGEQVRALSWVKSVDIPISQLTEQTDITFTIRMTLE